MARERAVWGKVPSILGPLKPLIRCTPPGPGPAPFYRRGTETIEHWQPLSTPLSAPLPATQPGQRSSISALNVVCQISRQKHRSPQTPAVLQFFKEKLALLYADSSIVVFQWNFRGNWWDIGVFFTNRPTWIQRERINQSLACGYHPIMQFWGSARSRVRSVHLLPILHQLPLHVKMSPSFTFFFSPNTLW